jgi:putative hydrolase of the HAD superfamily
MGTVDKRRAGSLPALPGAVLLDLDDTILTYDGVSDDCWQMACELGASRLPDLSAAALREAVEVARYWYWGDPERHRAGRLDLFAARRELVAIAFRRLGLDDGEAARVVADTYSVERERAVTPVAGAVDTLTRLRDAGCRLALITNGASDAQRRKIERFSLGPLFDCILVEGEFGVGKPDSRVFAHALAELGAASTAAWMVGDDLQRDIGGAQQLGIFSVWVDWASDGVPVDSPVRPDHVIGALPELLSAPGVGQAD